MAMKLLIWLEFAIFSAVYGSSIYFTAVPTSVHLPKNAALTASQISVLNKYLLGLSSRAPSTWTGTGDLFSRPKALALVSVMGVDALSLSSVRAVYPLDGDVTNMDPVSQSLKQAFGENFEWIEATLGKISGTTIANLAKVENEREIKSHVAPLRDEIATIYKIADSLKKSGAQLSASTPALLMLRVTGLPVAAQVSYDDYHNGVKELQVAIDYLTDALSIAFGDQAVVEVTTEQSPDIVKMDAASQKPHSIHKRQASVSFEEHIIKLREALNVYQFTSSDYPAIFAIFAGIVIILSIAVLFIAVGIWNMDPGKDSIIYRMTTTRMKKD